MISIIVAVSENNVIGKDNSLIWNLPLDMKFFKEKTMGHCIITGRKNYESIPEKYRPLPNRTNIIVTRKKDYIAQGALISDSIPNALTKAYMHSEMETDEIFIIGGGEIYKECIKFADRMYITKVHANFEGDTFFPEIDFSVWKETSKTSHKADDKHKYDFTFIEYNK
jgi:dihydrofolate reductase